jgi:hypothetical protein
VTDVLGRRALGRATLARQLLDFLPPGREHDVRFGQP